MVEILTDGCTRIVPAKPRGHSSPRDEGYRYSVAPAELPGWFAVMSQEWRGGMRLGEPQIVSRWESAQLAEIEARRLAMGQEKDEDD